MKKGHDHTPEEERRVRETALGETLGVFPASDPPSSLPILTTTIVGQNDFRTVAPNCAQPGER